MGILNYPGPLPIAVVLQWKGETVADALTPDLSDTRYVIANESVNDFTISGTVGGTTTPIERRASRGNRFFSDSLNTYTTSPVSGAALDALIESAASTYTIDLTFSYYTFFDALLEQMTRRDNELKNLANPNDSQRILDTFTHSNRGGSISIRYASATQALTSLPCTLVDKEVRSRDHGRSPAVKLVFELDFLTGIDAVRREAMRKLIAMDWSKLARYGRPENQSELFVEVWTQNVYAYLANYTDMARGERLRAHLVQAHKTKTPQQLSTDLRNEIDLFIVTANHWGQMREDMATERHQRLLSDLFGTLHQSAWLASPVHYLRDLQDDFSLNLNQVAAAVLQYGTGHCGEHAITSFSVLREVVGDPASQVSHVIHSGNANIDHAFVVYNLDVDEVIQTKATASNNSRVSVDQEITVWNLREAMAKNTTRTGYVMDPYLDQSVMKPTSRELLDALNNRSRQANNKETDFLAFGGEFPSSFTTVDIRNESTAVRRARVKHV